MAGLLCERSPAASDGSCSASIWKSGSLHNPKTCLRKTSVGAQTQMKSMIILSSLRANFYKVWQVACCCQGKVQEEEVVCIVLPAFCA